MVGGDNMTSGIQRKVSGFRLTDAVIMLIVGAALLICHPAVPAYHLDLVKLEACRFIWQCYDFPTGTGLPRL